MNTTYNIQDTYKYITQILSTKNFWNIDNNVWLFYNVTRYLFIKNYCNLKDWHNISCSFIFMLK